jgi:SOS-response transcriptional repressor LexA
MATFTPTQGRYLSYIHAYTNLHGYPPAESEIAAALCVSPPSVNLMVKTLERRGLISRQPGTPRSIRVLVPESEIPSWRTGRAPGRGLAASVGSAAPAVTGATVRSAGVGGSASATSSAAPSVNLYVLKVFLAGGPVSPQFANREISRVIEIRGDQTLQQLHEAIFHAFDRWEHLYEFHSAGGHSTRTGRSTRSLTKTVPPISVTLGPRPWTRWG